MAGQWTWRRGLGRALVLAGLLAAGGAAAATHYVAPTGSKDGDGTRAQPYSLTHVLNALKLAPGDEVVLLDGVYALGSAGVTISSIGTYEKPISYRAEHRHQAILDGSVLLDGWAPAPGLEGVWQRRVDKVPARLLVNGDGLVPTTSTWRRDGKETLDEGMFASEAAPADAPAKDELAGKPPPGKFLLLIRPWARQAPKEAFATETTVLNVSGAFNIVDGLLLRRGGTGVRVGGTQVHAYKPVGIYQELSGLANNAFGSFNIVRNCIIRDMVGQGMTSNESRFNLIEDNVIYNAGMGQGDHGIYISQGAENLTLRRNVWWRTSGGAIHIYSGTGVDSPRDIVVEYNIFGPDKRNRCFPLANRKSCALYIWGGYRYAGGNRITHNLILGPYDRAISLHKCSGNVVAYNVFLGSDGATLQFGTTMGNVVANNIIEYGPGAAAAPGAMEIPAGYVSFLDEALGGLSLFRNNVYLPRGAEGKALPAWEPTGRVAAAELFVGLV